MMFQSGKEGVVFVGSVDDRDGEGVGTRVEIGKTVDHIAFDGLDDDGLTGRDEPSLQGIEVCLKRTEGGVVVVGNIPAHVAAHPMEPTLVAPTTIGTRERVAKNDDVAFETIKSTIADGETVGDGKRGGRAGDAIHGLTKSA